MSSIRLSEKYGLNPGLMQCYFCLEASGVLLYGANGGKEAPRMNCIDEVPCSKCEEYMKQGIILISARDEDQEKLFWHWVCPDCGYREEVLATDKNEHSRPLCENPKCRWSTTEVMRNVGKAPTRNPYRTGGWVVVREEFITRNINPPELVESILRKRAIFVPDKVWDKIGLPRVTSAKPSP